MSMQLLFVLTQRQSVSSYEHVYHHSLMCRSWARDAEAGGPSMMLSVGFEQPSLDAGKHAISNCQITLA